MFINAFTICPRYVIASKNINDAQFLTKKEKHITVCVVQKHDNTQPLHNLKTTLNLFLLIVIF